MIFLKRIEAFGFKSFAEPVVINYDFAMTGIVGPNGSGKSNITDAIMWALGEQSSKSLRGDSMEDIVFSGSSDRKGLNMAEVTLVFDNSSRAFKTLDYNEVSITRKYFLTTRESEYYINNSQVRLKDVQEVALETGLTKSSLAIISQGSISNFVESSPEQRRRLFDEAAGVAVYKKRKEDAVRKLSRTQDNLDRINDIINEIERKLPTLKRQSIKAKEYQNKFNELKSIEVAVLVKDIQLYKQRAKELTNQKFELKNLIKDLEKNISIRSEQNKQISSKAFENDKEISLLNKEFESIVENIGNLKVAKVNLESKKRTSEIDDKEFKISDLKSKAKQLEDKLKSEEQKLAKLLVEKISKRESLDEHSKNRYFLNKEAEVLRKEIAKVESFLETIIQRKNSLEGLFEGVKNIIENKKVLPGIIGTVQELINVDQKFETAIASVMQNATQNIVAKNSNDVKIAIEFLKKNNAGYATFLPLDNLTASYLPNDIRFAVQNLDGFVGFANQLIKIEKKYQIILDYLLANYIVVENYDNAIETAKTIKFKYNIVTLDGQRILPHGAVVGGSRKVKNTQLTDNTKIKSYEEKKLELENQENNKNQKINFINNEIEKLREEQAEIQTSYGASNKTKEQLEKQLLEIKDEYRVLTGKDLDNDEQQFQSLDEQIISMSKQILDYETKKEEVQQKLNVIRNLKEKAIEKQNVLNESLEEERKLLSAYKDNYQKINSDHTLIVHKKETAVERLSENYNLTFEAALETNEANVEDETKTREKIKQLRSEINSLGNINFDSIEEFEAENERYQTYVEQSNDINDSINNLKDAINEMDEQMTIQFKNIVKDANSALPVTFSTLFGGGTAQIVYTNPEDILTTGIDIKISPPGKKIINLNLLSGGEKSLVALAVLFSILKVKPIPLVILDEVEAPLDIANVERFAKYIKTFTSNTQFMIVTHRMGTMENCDVLFGATMQQKGITKLVQIKLIEAKQLSNTN
ncbi:chromosome condensation and segregation SMC ATPase [Spiroplasma gladiatoris]|uniref:Chromosome partition protein Smc n=1 Tax=Spiroplasma gladiatoris TaxID=2143 RepID=A0A4P7AHT4_9MOLU|nr:AAA family ATPase [Spiroplasma gladiatoris]QBQ08004.1 chromosome condensation and segregation SMC ATPase [Spiroplasma gladiatoris]